MCCKCNVVLGNLDIVYFPQEMFGLPEEKHIVLLDDHQIYIHISIFTIYHEQVFLFSAHSRRPPRCSWPQRARVPTHLPPLMLKAKQLPWWKLGISSKHRTNFISKENFKQNYLHSSIWRMLKRSGICDSTTAIRDAFIFAGNSFLE